MKCLICGIEDAPGVCDSCWQHLANFVLEGEEPDRPEFDSQIAEDADSAGYPITSPRARPDWLDDIPF